MAQLLLEHNAIVYSYLSIMTLKYCEEWVVEYGRGDSVKVLCIVYCLLNFVIVISNVKRFGEANHER